MERLLTGSRPYQVERTWSSVRSMGMAVDDHLRKQPAQLLLSNSSLPLTLVRAQTPCAFFTDATFKGLITLYPELQDYPAHYLAEGEDIERQAIHRASCLIYTSQWAAQSAIHDYGAAPEKVHVVPRGSALGGVCVPQHIDRSIGQRSGKGCELLFMGVSWERKGGPLALAVHRALRERGVSSRLTVVGCVPPKLSDLQGVEVYPFLNKSVPHELALMTDLFLRSHFLLVPSIAECFGIVFTEAASMGVPSLTRASGGVSEAVLQGITGHVFHPHADPREYADLVQTLLSDTAAYERLCRSAFATYQDRWDWNIIGTRIYQLLHAAVQGYASGR